MNQIKQDQQLIMSYGGPSSVARIMGYKFPGGHARVCNWMRRGIPTKVKVERPDLFMPTVAVIGRKKK